MQNQLISARQFDALRGYLCAALGWFIFSLTPADPAIAAALSNNDSTTYRIEVRSKSGNRLHELAPGKSITEFCKVGCIIRLNGDAANDYELEGRERVSIEGGLVYYDGEEVTKAVGTQVQTK